MTSLCTCLTTSLICSTGQGVGTGTARVCGQGTGLRTSTRTGFGTGTGVGTGFGTGTGQGLSTVWTTGTSTTLVTVWTQDGVPQLATGAAITGAGTPQPAVAYCAEAVAARAKMAADFMAQQQNQ